MKAHEDGNVTLGLCRDMGDPALWEDPRFMRMYSRLRALSKEQLRRIQRNIDHVCFDTYNFDEATMTFCPLAVAHGLYYLQRPTDRKIYHELNKIYPGEVNILKGCPGKFYTVNRREDLLFLVEYLLA